ncbi:MAG TPA: hypothetical protein DCS82_05560 [Rhodospirillaceae bacterium]|nr:hypothetical protein [Rhodospirillaceae bacterium]HAA91526.1 hypothetical protein [Rhodospirillaceae bacterium]HAT35162.1 hypothetical protein [Rhodospirillaceae bacterium]
MVAPTWAQQADWQTPKTQSAEPKPIGSPRDVARFFVKHTGVNRNFIYILLHATQTSPQVQALYGQFPKEKVDKAVRIAIQPVVRKHFAEWEANLALTYLEFFTPEVLHSLATERTNSPYFGEFQAKSPKVGPRMRERIAGLLNEASVEAINIVRSELKKTP